MSDAPLCALAAASYDPAPKGLVIDWRDCRIVIDGSIAAVRGTVPDVMENWLRDLQVADATCREHPQLGACASGALDAAEALVSRLPEGVRTITGHSLGGQIGVLLAGLLTLAGQPVELVTWDAPKAGHAALAAVLAGNVIRQYRFRGSVVTHWPLLLDRHAREPLIDICPWTLDPVEAHSIGRAVKWLQTNTVVMP